jgi:hypothetical protein
MVIPVNVTGCLSAVPPAAPAAVTTVKVNWVYSSRPYAPVTVKCGDGVSFSWTRSAHNLLVDTQGGWQLQPRQLQRCAAPARGGVRANRSS